MLTEYIVVDLEMTGLKPTRDKILEIGAVHVKCGQIIGEFEVQVNPRVPIPPEIVGLTKITQEMAESGTDVKTAIIGFLEFCGELPLVGHNIIYDYSFLKQNAINCDQKITAGAVDTLKLSRKLYPELETKTLSALCRHFHIIRTQEHRALEDAKATAQLLEIMQKQFGEQQPELFEPQELVYKVKKQGPITQRQKKYLKELTDYHKIELMVTPDGLTRSEASRLTDEILSKYGKIPKKMR